MAGALEVGYNWREQELEPFEDYRRFWKNDPPAITAIGLMQDTDMTGRDGHLRAQVAGVGSSLIWL